MIVRLITLHWLRFEGAYNASACTIDRDMTTNQAPVSSHVPLSLDGVIMIPEKRSYYLVL